MKDKKLLNENKKAGSLFQNCLWGVLLFAVLVLIDQLTKLVADVYFNQPTSPAKIDVIPHWISLTIAYNDGIAYGIGGDSATSVKIGVIIATGVMMAGLSVFFFVADKRRSFLRSAFVFIVAGGVGNLIDRVHYKVWTDTLYGVRDMVDLSRFGFAVCNFADFFITAGAIMLVLSLLFFDKDAIFPVGKYKALAKESERREKEKAEKKAGKNG